MCGIVGIAKIGSTSPLDEKDRSVFLQLLSVGLVRGEHGTGVAKVNKKGKFATIKMAGPAHNLMVSKEFHAFWEKVKAENTHILIGHNRLATRGEKTAAHAHPFTHDDIVMVHNGTLDSTSTIEDFKDYAVDSEALAVAISKSGLKKALAQTSGAYAIVYFDSKNKTLNFIRNSQRPMHLMIDTPTKTITWASEKLMVEWINERNYRGAKINGMNSVELPSDELWSFDLTEWNAVKKEPIMGKSSAGFYPTTSSRGGGSHGCAVLADSGFEFKNGIYSPKGYTEGTKGAIDRPVGGPNSGLPAHVQAELQTHLETIRKIGEPAAKTVPTTGTTPATVTPQTLLGAAKVARDRGLIRRSPRYSEVNVATKNYAKLTEYLPDDLMEPTVKVGQMIAFIPTDLVEDAAQKDGETITKYYVIGHNEALKKVRLHLALDDSIWVDAVFEARKVGVEVANILRPVKGKTSDEETIFWVKNPSIE